MTFVARGFVAASAALMLSGAGVMAQGGHSHVAANGGQIQQIGAYEAELVVKGADVMLYIVDKQEKKVDAAKFSATAVVLAADNQQKTVEMSPSGENRLAGKIDFPVTGKIRATVTLKSGTAEAGKGRYSLDAR
ncbi:MAG: adenylosuccinate synthase [Stutzerimonas stutzeri]|uniref:Adenylosuccinate synthase n=1 Tax=Bosea eneae TaxID=151454 RepID=A0ABW0J220_9HYPH|nr:MAG: adenylosuccinate synthase [Stutzerimonas stutzeri]